MALNSFKFLADFVILLNIPIAVYHSILEPGARASSSKWFETMTTLHAAARPGIALTRPTK